MGQTADSSEHTKKFEETVAELRSQLSHANKEINTINDKLTIKTLEVNELKEQLAAFNCDAGNAELRAHQ
jgi:hypothetical protein